MNDLPLLTHIAQVDTSNECAMIELQVRIITEYEKQIELDSDLTEELIPEFVSACKFTQQILETLVDRHGLYPNQLNELNNWLKWTPRQLRSIAVPDPETGLLPANSFFDTALVRGRASSVVKRVIETVEMAVSLFYDRLTRCDECDSIFLRSEHKHKQRFCSDRCSTRVRMRNLRSRNKFYL